MLTVQNSIIAILGGTDLPLLDSVSLRLQKMVNVEQRVSDKELQNICSTANRNKSQTKKAFAAFPYKLSVTGAKSFNLRLGGRMLVDHSGGVLENANLCLHRNFGFPYIPGSALKGIARHAAWCDWDTCRKIGNLKEAEKLATLIAETFGYPTGDSMPKKMQNMNRANQSCYLDDFLSKKFPNDFASNGKKATWSGAISFLPACPVNNQWQMVVDVLTSHQDCDTKNPIPVFFPAIERGAIFRFSIAPILGRNTETCLPFALKYLKKGLIENGAGAKTTAGYGWFIEETDNAER